MNSKLVKDFFKKTSDNEMFVRWKKSESVQFDVAHFMSDSILEFPLKSKSLFFENERTLKSKKEIEYGAGSTFRREKAFTKKEDDTKKPKNFLLTVIDEKKSKEDPNKKFSLRGVPTDISESSHLLLFQKNSRNEVFAYPVTNSYKISTYREMPIEEDLEIGPTGLDKIKKYDKVRETETYKDLNITGRDDQEDGALSDGALEDKKRNEKKKRSEFLKKQRYGNRDKHAEESGDGDQEHNEIDYISSESSMDEEKLDESEKQLIYETNGANEENDIVDKVNGKDELLENEEEDLEKKAKELKKGGANASDVEDDAEDDADNEEDEEDEDYDKDDSDNSSSDHVDKSDTKSKKRNFMEAFSEESSSKSAKRPCPEPKSFAQQLSQVIMQQPERRIPVKTLYKQMMKNGLLQNNMADKNKFFVAADEIGAQTENFNGVVYMRI